MNGPLDSTRSLRFLGLSDTTTPSVSIYSGVMGNLAGGMERTFTGMAAANFGFVPSYMVLTGRSSYTGFANDDFSGNSTCFSTPDLMETFSLHGIEIRSLVKGCNSKFNSARGKVEAKL